jgi:hypothetical protein
LLYTHRGDCIDNPIRENPLGKTFIAFMLHRLILGSNSFGKTVEKNLEETYNLFIDALGDYNINDVYNAFKIYIESSASGIPEPSDIIRIIDFGIVTCDPYLIKMISKKDKSERTVEEQSYLDRYLAYKLKENSLIKYHNEVVNNHNDSNNIDPKIREYFDKKYGDCFYRNWISKLVKIKECNNEVTFSCGSKFILEHISSRYINDLNKICGKKVNIMHLSKDIDRNVLSINSLEI